MFRAAVRKAAATFLGCCASLVAFDLAPRVNGEDNDEVIIDAPVEAQIGDHGQIHLDHSSLPGVPILNNAHWSHGPRCSCGIAPSYDSLESGAALGGLDRAGMGDADADTGYGYLSESFGAGRGAYGSGMGMVGDFFSSGYLVMSTDLFEDAPAGVQATLPIAGGDRRFKIADNNSPFPMDRVFFNYHHFQNAVTRWDGSEGNVDRYMFGLEKTFRGGLWSVEVRAPIVNGLNSDQVVDGTNTNFQATEFGNLGFALKRLLYRGDFVSTSIGVGMITPTADNARLFNDTGLAVEVKNEAFYLQPFFGVLMTPTDRWFTQFVVQADFDVRGNPVDVVGSPVLYDARMQDQSLLYLDLSMGYWIYRNPYGRVSGIAPMLELHSTSTMQDSDVYVGTNTGDTVTIVNPRGRTDVLNMTFAVRTEFGNGSSYLTFAAVTPLRQGNDRFFDGEFAAQFTRMY